VFVSSDGPPNLIRAAESQSLLRRKGDNMKSQTISLALTILLLCFRASAQWVQTNGPYGGNIRCIVGSGTNLFAGTQGSGVYRSTNGGTWWSAVNAGLTDHSGTSSSVFALALSPDGTGGTNLFAGTEGDGVFRSTNNGSTWTWTSSGLTYTSVLSIVISGPNLFAGIVGGGVYRSTNNGTNWNRVGPYVNVLCLATSGPNVFAGCPSSIFHPLQNATMDHELSVVFCAMRR
jgi:hypothetical protein